MTKFFTGVGNLFDRQLLPVYYSKHLPLCTTLSVQHIMCIHLQQLRLVIRCQLNIIEGFLTPVSLFVWC